jgi:Fe-S-cluster-containing dehydrogenase component/anaerobic selenocysteine-containing dehydrogenase
MTEKKTAGGFRLPGWTARQDELIASTQGDEAKISLVFPEEDTPMDVSRRDFLRVAGAGAAAAGITAACRVPQDQIVPHVDRPEEVWHGTPNVYTSVCGSCSVGCGTLMTAREGRVQKLEGNPEHPVSQGKLCARGQASIFDLYDPSRVTGPKRVTGGAAADSSWDELDQAVIAALKGGKATVLTLPQTGPATLAALTAFGAKVVAWEPLAATSAAAAEEKGFGTATLPRYDLARASTVVTFGSDFLGTDLSPVEYGVGVGAARSPDNLSRITAFESRQTITGGHADIRHRVKPSDFLFAALGVAHELIIVGKAGGTLGSDPNVRAALKGYAGMDAKLGLADGSLAAAAASLKAAGKNGVAIAGRAGGDSTALQAVVALINESLGNRGTTVSTSGSRQGIAKFAEFKQLVADMAAGSVDVLIINGLNPVYDAPPALGFAAALAKVKTVVTLDTHATATGLAGHWIAAGAHFIEAWGDTETVEGMFSLQQPGMSPVFKGARGLIDCLVTWGDGNGKSAFKTAAAAHAGYKDDLKRTSPGAGYFWVREHWSTHVAKATGTPFGGTPFWEAALRKGVLTTGGKRTWRFDTSVLKGVPGARPERAGMELELFAPLGVYDGRHANNGSLQEMPDPVTHVSWGDYVALAPKKFTELGLKAQGDIVKVTAGDQSADYMAVPMPGLPHDAVAVPLGYGREHAGIIGGGIGNNSYKFAQVGEDGVVYSGIEVTVAATGATGEIGIAFGAAHVIDQRARYIVPVTTKPEYDKDPGAGAHKADHPGIWNHVHEYKDLRWGMSIDLTKCTGCSACVTACQVENNVPVVGKQGIREGRLMHWIRLDRYWVLPDTKPSYEPEMLQNAPEIAAADYLENPEFLIQPILCQHCENAPCETVCPVAATTHTETGINTMTYNRCVGTRYCLNNCPYKVRRFNWYNYNADRSDELVADIFPEMKEHSALNGVWPESLRFNPEVTVRSRGVMEKCSFCAQRLRKTSKVYRKLGLFDGEPQTACQQTCPSGAISFGNILDEKTATSGNFKSPRAYSLLEHVGARPSIRYLTRVRNVDATAEG